MGIGSSTERSGPSRNRPHSYSGPSTKGSAGGRATGHKHDTGGLSHGDGRFNNRNSIIDNISTDPEGPEEVRKTLLHVKECDFDIARNAVDHHTNLYDIVSDKENKKLLIRRGQAFTFKLTFDRPYKKDEDRISVVFQKGNLPKEMKGFRVVLPLYTKPQSKTWSIEVVEQKDNQVTFRVAVSPNCPIGSWEVRVNSLNKNDQEPALEEWISPEHIYIIFNPWCEDDPVFSADANFRKHYLEMDEGKIFVGSTRRISYRNWDFAQYEDPVLQCVIRILEEVGNTLPPSAMADPVKVVRKLTSVVNSSDNNGVLTGNWSGDYSGGTSPTQWVGSQAILEEFWKTKQSVMFGQCWVFSGILTTCCRAIGIPARSVTNFSSAHDTDGSLTIDRYNGDDKSQKDIADFLGGDSIWNFHVWNDAWMSRPDLPGDFGGWQACDATPQETSDGFYCCGPCPLKAIKAGLVNMPYDAPFIFAEVNGDVVYWQVHGWNDYTVNNIHRHSVGKYISTLGMDGQREDVTNEYKDKDFAKEREAFTKALASLSSAENKRKELEDHYAFEDVQPDVLLELVDNEDVLYGDTYIIMLKATNKCSEKRTVDVTLNSKSFYYTGVQFKPVKKNSFFDELDAGASKTFEMPVTFDEYEPAICERCSFKIFSTCKVKETGNVYFHEDIFDLIKPEIKVLPQKEVVKVGETVKVEVSFVNSLPKTLTGGVLTVEGTGLQRLKKFKLRVFSYVETVSACINAKSGRCLGAASPKHYAADTLSNDATVWHKLTLILRTSPVKGNETFKYEFDITPFKAGDRRLLLDFSSVQMIDVKGEKKITVTE